MDKLHWKSAAAIARLIREKKLSASEVLEHFLARVDRFNPKLNAIVWQDRERARQRAKAADAALARGEIWGPLHGVPMTIKESYNVTGSPVEASSVVSDMTASACLWALARSVVD